MITKGARITKIRYVDPNRPEDSVCLLFHCCQYLGMEGDNPAPIDPAFLVPEDMDHFCGSQVIEFDENTIATLTPPQGACKASVQVLAADPDNLTAIRASRVAISTRDGQTPDVGQRNGNEHSHFSSFTLSQNELSVFQIRSVSPPGFTLKDKAIINYYI